jgi:hypothetical protein
MTTPPAPLKVPLVNTEQWNVVVVTYPAHANKNVRHKKLQKLDSKQCGPRANRATCTIYDFTDERKGALSMTSPMDAK